MWSSHVILKSCITDQLSRYKFSVTLLTLFNMNITTIKFCTSYAILADITQFGDWSISVNKELDWFLKEASNCLYLLFSRTISLFLWAFMSAQIVCFFAIVLDKAWNWSMVPLEALNKEKKTYLGVWKN